LATSIETSGYQFALSETFDEAGEASIAANLLIAWPLIIDGLTSFASGISAQLSENEGAETVQIFVSPMHIWAIAEAARVFPLCFDKNRDMPELYDSAHTLSLLCEGQNTDVTALAHPYLHVQLVPV